MLQEMDKQQTYFLSTNLYMPTMKNRQPQIDWTHALVNKHNQRQTVLFMLLITHQVHPLQNQMPSHLLTDLE